MFRENVEDIRWSGTSYDNHSPVQRFCAEEQHRFYENVNRSTGAVHETFCTSLAAKTALEAKTSACVKYIRVFYT